MPKEPTTEVVRGCLYTWMLIGRLDGRTPPEITLITSLHEFVCPYNLSINGKQIWLDAMEGSERPFYADIPQNMHAKSDSERELLI